MKRDLLKSAALLRVSGLPEAEMIKDDEKILKHARVEISFPFADNDWQSFSRSMSWDKLNLDLEKYPIDSLLIAISGDLLYVDFGRDDDFDISTFTTRQR